MGNLNFKLYAKIVKELKFKLLTPKNIELDLNLFFPRGLPPADQSRWNSVDRDPLCRSELFCQWKIPPTATVGYGEIQNQWLRRPSQAKKSPRDTKNTMDTKVIWFCYSVKKTYVTNMYELLTNLRRQVFSRSAPTHPAKLTINTTPPAITITREMFRTTS